MMRPVGDSGDRALIADQIHRGVKGKERQVEIYGLITGGPP